MSQEHADALITGMIAGLEKHAGQIGSMMDKRIELQNANSAMRGAGKAVEPAGRAYQRRLVAGKLRRGRAAGLSNTENIRRVRGFEQTRLDAAEGTLAATRRAPLRDRAGWAAKRLLRK